MRKMLCFLMLVASLSLGANPIVPRVLQQFWFTDFDDVILQFGPEAHYIHGAGVQVSDGIHSGAYILDFTGIPDGSPMNVYLSEILPSFNVTREQGYLLLSYDSGAWAEEVSWGQGNSGDLQSIIATQSIYQTSVQEPQGWYQTNIWAKSDHPDYVQNYSSSSSCTIQLYVRDEESEPVESVAVFYGDFNENPWATSDEDGYIELELPCARTHLKVYHPDSEAPIFDELFFAEPAGCYVFNVEYFSTSLADDHLIQAMAVFTLYPGVVKPGQVLNLKVEQSREDPDQIKLYDLKGRLVGDYPFFSRWQLPSLSSGIYFVQVSSQGKILGRRRIIMLH